MDTINNNSLNATLIAVALFAFSSAQAAPSLNQVTSGNATVTQDATNTTINQTTNNATIDWHSFNVAQNQAVVFNQPTTQSLTINNILDANPSQILGSITANGRVVLLNPNGFFFGANSSISAHTFIAAATTNSNTTYNPLTNTLSIINNDNINGTITNNGTITATKTQLIAKKVANNANATINGAITITATQDATLHGTLNATTGNIDIFSNGTIRGSVDTNSINTAFNTTGELSLSGTHTATGTLTLTASPLFLESTAVLNTDTLTITSPNSFALISATTNAYTHTYTSNTSLTFINAKINSSSGTITIGNKTTPTITINDTTTISSNATGSNDAGEIIIFSSNHTKFYGTATATAEHGDGGLIELSSHGTITHSSPLNISTTSTYGTTGTLLIDPVNILIADPATFNTFNNFRALLTGTTLNTLQIGANFGDAVALSSTYALIGAELNDYTGIADTGNAFLYNLSNYTWINLLATPNAPSLQRNSFFGRSVALNDTYALIGAPGVLSDRGDAYLYKLDGANGFNSTCATTTGTPDSPWCTLSSSSMQPVTSSGNFGFSVALNDTYALIGATGVSSDRGDAYLYTLDGTDSFTSTCATTGVTPDSPWCTLSSSAGQPIAGTGGLVQNSRFGASVALNDTYALIGATGTSGQSTSRGNAFLYKLDGTDAFTSTCATTGVTPTSPWCTLSDSTGQPIAPIGGMGGLDENSYFGFSVALNDTYALIGAYGVRVSSNQGNAYLYKLDGTVAFTSTCATTPSPSLNSPWCSLTSSALQPITTSAANFGYSVALNDTYALIGAVGASGQSIRGNAYLYKLDGANSFDGNCATTGNLNSPWCNLSSSIGQPISILPLSSNFGRSVALNDTYALIGAIGISSFRGNAYLYNLSNGTWTDLFSAANLSRVQANTNFGWSVALSSTHALIGAAFYDYSGTNNSGNAYLYNLSTGTWINLLATTGAPSAQAVDTFGYSVALSATHALIGAVGHNYSGNTDSGNAYLYNLSGGTNPWTDLLATTGAPAPQAFGRFGFSVALSSTHALIGARFNQYSGNTMSGNAYLYTISDGSWTGTDGLLSVAGASTQAFARFGYSVALSSTHALIGAIAYSYSGNSASGNAYLYTISDGSWTGTNGLLSVTGSPALQAFSQLGASVALTATHALIGADDYDYTPSGGTALINSGNAFLYTISDGTWTNLLTTTGAPALQERVNFGVSVALSSTLALIGTDSNAFLYRLSGGTGAWTNLLGTANAPTPQSNDDFGNSLALSSRYALVGANAYDYTPPGGGTTLTDAGNAYLFTLAPATDIPAFDTVVSPASILTALAANNVSYTATNRIYVYRPIDLGSYTGTNALTLTAPNIHFNLSGLDTGNVAVAGATNNGNATSVIIERPAGSGPWTSSNLTLPTSGISVLSTNTPGFLAGISSSARGVILITKPTGDITIANSPTAMNLALSITASMGSINFGTNVIDVARFSAVSDTGNITGGTLTASSINLSATMGSIGTVNNRIRIRSRGITFDTTGGPGFMATANTTNGNVFLSTNNSALIGFVNSENRMVGGPAPSFTQTIISEKAPDKKPGGALSAVLDPILDLLGSGCEKDDVLATVVSGFGILCGEE